MIWTAVKPCTPCGAQWEAYPSDAHAIDVCPHQTEGWVWFVISDDVNDNAPEGWSATAEDAKRHAEQAYLEWLDVTEGRKPIPDEWLDAHDETADIVADAVAKERASVVAWLTKTHGWTCGDCGFNISDLADAIERGEHRREEER